ncbi:hypothetical protein N5853_09075 [Bartonella sp. HY329]|uniref:hypothetical protein n=1 Tax=unclassified Bartonella TaxID=2645622 RepID=UPI0021CA5050|nr:MULTISPECIES: hypothetical protein [unclassified Bartonella]UXM94258.1 hypothetical protein N5853_09075 [Bartonella sp. HY329]UXN08581.1 hypothetical protein N5852_09085 [Bartonella sp. HY328]
MTFSAAMMFGLAKQFLAQAAVGEGLKKCAAAPSSGQTHPNQSTGLALLTLAQLLCN